MSAQSQFKKLFEPARLGRLELSNRIVMPPIVDNLATPDGIVSQKQLDYFEARARGGVAMIIVESTCVDAPVGKNVPHMLHMDDDECISGLTQLAKVIKEHGAKAAIQPTHAGITTKVAFTGCQPVGPSAVARPGYDEPRALTVEGIHKIEDKFAEAAARAQKAGFDGVELHGAHGYLGAQFLSPAWNKRTDEYGGILENRARFLLEVMEKVREAVGKDFAVWWRLNGAEYGLEEFGIKNCITLEETQQVAQWLEKAGADAISVSCFGMGVYTNCHRAAIAIPRGNLIPLAEGVKKAVNIPVLAAGGLNPELGEKVLEEGKADFVCIGRGLLADPELPNKAASGNVEDINRCIRCNYCGDICNARNRHTGQIGCTVNAVLGHEGEHRLIPVGKKKRVMVVGGGPAGMEAARVAALRGHNVTLWEKSNALGGQVRLAIIPPHKEETGLFLDYLKRQVKKVGVGVKLGRQVDVGLVKSEKPDAVVLAVGAKPNIPDIPGINRDNVVLAEDVLIGKASIGDRVVVIGGEPVGCETAEYLAEKGKKVVAIITLELAMATKEGISMRQPLLDRLERFGIEMITGVIRCDEVNERGLKITTAEGKSQLLEADTVALAAGSKPNIGLAEELRSNGVEFQLAGDCIEPRRIMDAVAEGYRVGMAV